MTTARTLTRWAGITSVAVAIAHLAFFVVVSWSRWGGWLAGDLRGAEGLADPAKDGTAADFWALPGSFAIPLLLLGLLTLRSAKESRVLPAYVGWTLGGWALLCSVVIEPSGFPLGLVPSALYLAAHRVHHRTAGSVHKSVHKGRPEWTVAPD